MVEDRKGIILCPPIFFSFPLSSDFYGQKHCQGQPPFSSLPQRRTCQENPQAVCIDGFLCPKVFVLISSGNHAKDIRSCSFLIGIIHNIYCQSIYPSSCRLYFHQEITRYICGYESAQSLYVECHTLLSCRPHDFPDNSRKISCRYFNEFTALVMATSFRQHHDMSAKNTCRFDEIFHLFVGDCYRGI